MNKSTLTLIAALTRLKNRRGLIKPDAVVKAARNKQSPLHKYFTWDDALAGHKYRLWEARQLIGRVRVWQPGQLPTPIFVSLISDRKTSGYRETQQVLNNEELTAELERTAIAELKSWSERHSVLRGLVKSVMKAAMSYKRRKATKTSAA